MDKYREKAEEVAKKLQDYYNKEEGWTVTKKTKEGATISYRTSNEFEGYLYKGECIIDAEPATVFRYVDPLPDGPRGKWDSDMKKIETLQWLESDLRINRACTASACMGLISPRDFIDVVLTKETDSYISTNGVSVEYPSPCPDEKKYVRGWNYPCGLICVKIPDEPGKTKLVSLIQPDIGGMLPRSLVDQAIPGSMASFFSELKQALKKNGDSTKS